jgi:o-succinylbenzoate---CoA ligase
MSGLPEPPLSSMSPLQDNHAFWRSTECYIAVNPHRPDDSADLVELAGRTEETRSLLFFQTSGSESLLPHWVGLSREAFLRSAYAVNHHLEVTPQDRWIIALPLYHVGGFSILARCHASGSTYFHMSEKWTPHRFTNSCYQEKVTLASLVPTQVYDLVKAGLQAPPGLRAVVVGGGALAKDIGLRALAMGWPVFQSYGMTEACSQIATEPLDHLHSGFDPDSLEVLPNWEVQVNDTGTLTVRGPALASGYAVKHKEVDALVEARRNREHSFPAWTWVPLDPERGLVTRDHVQVWQHGTRQFLRFIGRHSSFVKVLGELVNLAALQARLDGVVVGCDLALGSAVIFPVPDERKETRLLLVGAHPQEKLETLMTEFNNLSIALERLDEVRVVGELPRTALGKVDIQSLKALLRE